MGMTRLAEEKARAALEAEERAKAIAEQEKEAAAKAEAEAKAAAEEAERLKAEAEAKTNAEAFAKAEDEEQAETTTKAENEESGEEEANANAKVETRSEVQAEAEKAAEDVEEIADTDSPEEKTEIVDESQAPSSDDNPREDEGTKNDDELPEASTQIRRGSDAVHLIGDETQNEDLDEVFVNTTSDCNKAQTDASESGMELGEQVLEEKNNRSAEEYEEPAATDVTDSNNAECSSSVRGSVDESSFLDHPVELDDGNNSFVEEEPVASAEDQETVDK